MNKEKILRKSRELKEDEGVENAANKGRLFGWLAICLVVFFECIFSFFTKQDISGILLMMCVFFAAENIPLYRFTRKKVYLVSIIVWSVASLSSLVSYILPYVR